MKSKKILLTILAACSCLPVSNANEQSQCKVSVSDSTFKDSKKNSNVLNPNVKNPPKPSLKRNSKENRSLFNNKLKYTIATIAPFSLGIVYIQRTKNRYKLPNDLPTEAYSYLWPWILLTNGYDTYYTREPSTKSPRISFRTLSDQLSFGSNDCLNVPSHFVPTESVLSFFEAVTKLYIEIINSNDFKSLIFNNNGTVFDRGKNEVLTKIKNQILGISQKIKMEDGKYHWSKPEKNKVYFEMPSGTEIETNCNIKDDHGKSISCSATFAKDDKGVIYLKTWKIGS